MHYDVIIIGAGHAGCEAALASARLGASTLLLTINLDHLAQMSCNPAIGGVAKGHLVREIDALGGAMGRLTDASTIQFRMLNRAKGPAVWSPRAQCDKTAYARAMKFYCEQHPNLHLLQCEAKRFIVNDGKMVGVINEFEQELRARAFVLSSGTFLRGKLHYGLNSFSGGRAGDPAANSLSNSLIDDLQLRLGRLKTGTPPRILGKSIDFSQMSAQYSESVREQFSFLPDISLQPTPLNHNLPCYMVHTNESTAQVVRDNLHQAPMYQGIIEGIGARYCPSFEDKVVRFPHHPKHLLYLEPEGDSTGEYYLNGISTSLPPDIQIQLIRSVPGLEQASFTRYAYAIEYDFVFPDQIHRSLQVKNCSNLFLAGQINGTSGYEEAAGQGLVAGLNAARLVQGKNPVEFGRDSSYLGVMIDDLVTKEIIEPYRLFTSRAEYRLRLRQDNADLRLSRFASELGLLTQPQTDAFNAYFDTLENTRLLAQSAKFEGKTFWDRLKSLQGDLPIAIPPEFAQILPDNLPLTSLTAWRILSQIAIDAHYQCYLAREESQIRKLHQLESWPIPLNFDFSTISGLGIEPRQKLNRVRPTTLAQASRIDGVSPSDIALLQICLNRSRSGKNDHS